MIFFKYMNLVNSIVFPWLVVPTVMLTVQPILNHPSTTRNGVTDGLHNYKVQGKKL